MLTGTTKLPKVAEKFTRDSNYSTKILAKMKTKTNAKIIFEKREQTTIRLWRGQNLTAWRAPFEAPTEMPPQSSFAAARTGAKVLK